MYIYGEDLVAGTTIPGMRTGETVAFYVDGFSATTTPDLVWSNDWTSHEVSLSATRPLAGPPKAPEDLHIERSGDDLVLTWQPVTEDVNGNPIAVSSYEVYCSLTDACFEPGFPGISFASAPTESFASTRVRRRNWPRYRVLRAWRLRPAWPAIVIRWATA